MRAPPGTPLYVHVPFCVSKCTYCDFYSLVADGQDEDGFVDLLLLEAERRAPRHPRTVFLGGGTPSHLSAERLRRLLDGLEALTGFRSSAREVTAECNPESLDEARAACLLELGVNRLSIGIQSLDPAVLKLFGRPHLPADGPRALAAARQAGARRVSVDLIYGHPGQSAADWDAELREILALRPDHLSAYCLTLEPGTALFAARHRGELVPLPEAAELELFWTTRRIAAEHGYAAYEISNFALAGERCTHNVNYWRNGPYAGIGPSAVSHVGRSRTGNPRSLERWRSAVRGGADPTEWTDEPDAGTRLAETWWLGLRLSEGVVPAVARRRAGWVEPTDPAAELALVLTRQGLLESSGARFRLSTTGLPVADALARAFLERCASGDPAKLASHTGHPTPVAAGAQQAGA